MICPQCARRFDNEPLGRRRVYCSAACRQRAYRQRSAVHNNPEILRESVRTAASAIREYGSVIVLLTEGWSPPEHLAGHHRIDHLVADIEHLAGKLGNLNANVRPGA